MRPLSKHLTGPLEPLVETFRNPDLRRLQLAWVGSILGGWSYLVALAVYAYGHGGAGAVALAAVLRMVPAAIISPFAATLADRLPRRLVMIGADLGRAALMGVVAAIIALDGPSELVYVIVGLSAVVGTAFRPAQAALLPALAGTPGELAAANVASSTLEAVGAFAGPAIGGFVLAATNAQTVFALNGASFVWSALLIAGIRGVTAPDGSVTRHRGSLGHESLAGFRTILHDRNVAVLVSLYSGQTFVAGTLTIFVVTTGLKLLERGPATVGALNAGVGIGGIVGGFVALLLATRGRLAADFALGVALFGAPLVLAGAFPHLAPVLIAMCLVGIGNSLVDISAITLLQRIVPDDVLGRVVGVLEGLLLGALALGALAAPLLIHFLGIRWALVAAGAFLPALVLLTAPRLRQLANAAPKPAVVVLLQGVEIFSQLPLPVVEQLATALIEVRVPAGSVVIRKGEAGDRFYVIGEGEVEIEGNLFGPGSSFGEIALLRDVPRTATVTARTDVLLHALERDVFLSAVTQHETSGAAADAVIARRLGELRADLTTEGGAT